MPLCAHCPDCSTLNRPSRAAVLVFIRTLNETDDQQKIKREMHDRNYYRADPLELSWDLMGLPPYIEYEAWFYTQPYSDYDPSYEWYVNIYMEDLLMKIVDEERLHELVPNFFGRIYWATCAPEWHIDTAIEEFDASNPGLIPDDDYRNIEMARRARQARGQEDLTDHLIEVGDMHHCPLPEEPEDPDLFG